MYIYIILYLNIHIFKYSYEKKFIIQNIIYEFIFKYKFIYNMNTYVCIIILVLVQDKFYFKAESEGNRSLTRGHIITATRKQRRIIQCECAVFLSIFF